jgi:transposase
VWARALEQIQALVGARGDIDWAASIDSTIVRVHQHGATLARGAGGHSNYKKFRVEPDDHAIGPSRGGLTTKTHLVCDGRGRPLAFVITGGQVADRSMLIRGTRRE